MKSFYIVSVLAGLATVFAGTASAAERKESASGAMKVSMRDTVSTPHYKPTGKPVSAARGQAIFLDHCALCHGVHGQGDGPRSAFFMPGGQYIPDMTIAAVMSGRDKELLGSIREGLRRLPEPAYVMPQFKYILSEEEIQSVFAYVKTLSSRTPKK
jgi:mono/diheme cytochrome c family protein